MFNITYFYKRSLILFSLLIFFYTTYTLFDYFLDDAFITLTYSKHYFTQGKPWYNLNDQIQGNGQTSILWMLIQSAFFYFKSINPIYLNKVITILCSLFILVSSYKLIIKKESSLLINLSKGIFVILISYWLALNVSHGLETIIYTLFLFLFLKNRNKNINYLIVFIFPFIRPEAIIFTIFYIFDTQIFSKEFYKRLGITILCVLVLLLYSIYYYNIITPLPFILKNTKEFSLRKLENLSIILLIFAPIIYFLFKNRNRIFFYLPLIFFIFYYSFFIDEVMNIFDRYRFPLMMYYLYFLLYEDFNNKTNHKRILFTFIISSLAMCFLFKDLNDKKKNYKYDYSVGMKNGPIFIGKYLKQESLKEHKTFNVINSDAGAIAYYSDSNIYDTWGLNNAYLLLEKKANNWDNYLSYLQKINPDYIILISQSESTFKYHLDFEEKIYQHFNLERSNPILIRKFSRNYYYFIYKIK